MYKAILVFVILISSTFSYSQNISSNENIEKALKRAKQENKFIFVNYLSTNCKVSKNMKKQMNRDIVNSVLSSNYIVIDIEVPKDETSSYLNCSNPIKSFNRNNCEELKFPFFYILNESGNITHNSFKNDDSNIGYPITESDMDIFIEIIGRPLVAPNLEISKHDKKFSKIALN